MDRRFPLGVEIGSGSSVKQDRFSHTGSELSSAVAAFCWTLSSVVVSPDSFDADSISVVTFPSAPSVLGAKKCTIVDISC